MHNVIKTNCTLQLINYIYNDKMKTYLPRIIDKVLEVELNAFGAFLITGPKWCGKTTSAKKYLKVY